MDLIEIDAASNTSVDDIRDLRDKVDFRPGEAGMKFYIIDEVHMLSKSAFNALLKTLEEPPPHVVFVLATTEPEKIPATITSRCQRFDFRRIKVEDVTARLRFIVEQEDVQVEEAALTLIARQGGGSMRDSISLLDQLTTYGNEILTLDLVRSVLGAADTAATKRLIDYLLQGDVGTGLALINEAVQSGVEPRQFALAILEYLRGLLLVKYDNGTQFINLPVEALDEMRPQATSLSAPRLLKMIERFNLAVKGFKSGAGEVTIPQLPLELAFVEMASISIEATAEATAEATLASSDLDRLDRADRIEKTTKPPLKSSVTPVKPQPVISQQSAISPPPLKTSIAQAESGETPESANDEVMEISLGILQEQWKGIGAALKGRNRMAQGLLNSGKLVSMSHNKVVMSLSSDLLKTRIDKFKPLILEVLDEVLGTAVGIEFVVEEAENQADAYQSSSSSLPPEVASPTAEKKTTFEDDPLIKSALDLGGKIKGTHPL